MNRLSKTLLLWILLLGACSPGMITPQTRPATGVPASSPSPSPENLGTVSKSPLELPVTEPPVPGLPEWIATISTPHIDPGPNGELPVTEYVTPEAPNECGYQWAYQDRPELTAQFDAKVKNVIPNSTSHVTAFGENCIGNNGQVIKFLAMETDFYVTASVETLDEYGTFGTWLVEVMQLVTGIPPDHSAGPRPGFVEFRFEKSSIEGIRFRVPIQQYNEIADGKTGEELLRMFYTAP